jgi:hypothetical protein
LGDAAGDDCDAVELLVEAEFELPRLHELKEAATTIATINTIGFITLGDIVLRF